MIFLALLLFSCLLSLGITGLVKQYSSRQLLDIPNARSSHTLPTPRGGGLGFILAFAIVGIIYASLTEQFSLLISLWLVLTPLALVGFLDDRWNLPATVRYLVQLLAASVAIAYFGTAPLWGLSNLGMVGKILTIAFSVIGITATINFYNFMDGLDGLIAGVTTLQLAFIGLYLHQPLFLLLAAALVGFLWWNWSPAKIFMGDVGSTVLGASVAIALLTGRHESPYIWSLFTITLPLIGDAVYTLARRLWQGENIFHAHCSHIYQRLQQSGLSHANVAAVYMLLTAVNITIVSLWDMYSVGINLIATLLAIGGSEWYLQRQTLASN
ncbi:glycosyltransferase family 4 protein [Myxosarcina sp. GI1]|uniref:MraY family glycosyltransferase n=1 Tax=Myxosarcina sp. GI1 TaxID=1541065 RepID=UPI000564BBD0